MPWWGWVVVGAALLATEMLVPMDFWLLFIGLAAIAMGLLDGAGLDLSPSVEVALFGVLAVLFTVFFRRLVRRRFVQRGADARVDDTLVGEVAMVREALAPGATGRAELRGTVWTARNGDAAPLEPGVRARVERVEGLLLILRREA